MNSNSPATSYYRWKTGQPRVSHVFRPLPAKHPAIGHTCPACTLPLAAGQSTRLWVVGADAEDVEDMRADRWFAAAAEVIHADCDVIAEARALVEGLRVETPDPGEPR